MVQKSTTLFSEYYFRVLNLPAACFALCAGRGPSGGTERKQPAERKSGRSSGAEHGGSQKTRWRLPAAFCSNLLALLQNKKTSGPAAGGFSASNCIKYCSSSGDISARSFCKNSSAACWVMLAILVYTCADISSIGKFLYSVADVTSIRNIFRDTSALVLPASLCALVGLKEVNTGARMRWYSTVAHNCHGKIFFVTAKSFSTVAKSFSTQVNIFCTHVTSVPVIKWGWNSHFTSLYAAPYLGLLTNFTSCVFVVGLVWRIFKWSIEPLQLRRRIFKTLISRSYLINFLITGGFLWLALFAILSLI